MISTIVNVHIDAVEHGDKIVFLHSVKDGPANQSYGLQVAQLAGVPRNVIAQAKKKLISLENASTSLSNRTAAPVEGQNLPLSLGFNAEPEPRDEVAEQLKAELEAVDPDELTPRQALDELYRLRGLLK